jgi:hypothetical protein
MFARSIIFHVCIAVMVAGVLPVAESHQYDGTSKGFDGGHHFSAAHNDQAMTTLDGEHVHFHQCCAHAVYSSDPQLPGSVPFAGFTASIDAGDIRDGTLSPPFRPPTV